jgi:hypothetical protein
MGAKRLYESLEAYTGILFDNPFGITKADTVTIVFNPSLFSGILNLKFKISTLLLILMSL